MFFYLFVIGSGFVNKGEADNLFVFFENGLNGAQ